MPRKKRRTNYTQPKYVVRRVVLLVLCCALAGFAAYKLLSPGPELETSAREPETRSEPEFEAESETESGRQSEQQPLESEPESSPGVQEQSQQPQAQPQPQPQSAVDGDWTLLLVGPTSPLPEGYVPELQTVNDGYRVDTRIADSLARMFTAAKEDGISLMICSAYRSPEKQQELFQNQMRQYISNGYDEEQADALTVSAIMRPGNSEHHTGLAVDIVTPDYQTLDEGFARTPAFKWLDENAHKYGFVMRYPKSKQEITQVIYESWHYRYVGVEHAAVMKEKGYCLEEYLHVRQGGQLETEQAAPEQSSEDERQSAEE